MLLLNNGFADGAHARWRTLHEVTIIAIFISQNDNDLANRYLVHKQISDYKDAEIYNKYRKQLNFEPYPIETFNDLKRIRDDLIEKYGKDFTNRYGWATEILSNKNPNFTNIEDRVGYSHMRPFYRMANFNIHAHSQSIFNRLGSHPKDDSIIVAGKSLFGLGDPIQNTAYSITNLTTTLLLSKPNLDRLAIVTGLRALQAKIFEIVDQKFDQ